MAHLGKAVENQEIQFLESLRDEMEPGFGPN